MLDLNAVYEVVTFAIGDTKAGSKMGKLQVKNLNESVMQHLLLTGIKLLQWRIKGYS